MGEMHIIITTKNIFDSSRLSKGAFDWSIVANGTNGTNGIAVIQLVIHWWKASHYKELEYQRLTTEGRA